MIGLGMVCICVLDMCCVWLMGFWFSEMFWSCVSGNIVSFC